MIEEKYNLKQIDVVKLLIIYNLYIAKFLDMNNFS
jgi:hypothetical protein